MRVTRYFPWVGSPEGCGVSVLLLGTGHFLGSQGVRARSGLFSGLSYTELLLFWPQKSILVVPGWYLTPESPQPQAGTPPTSSPSKPRPLQHSLLNPRQWGISPALVPLQASPLLMDRLCLQTGLGRARNRWSSHSLSRGLCS